MPWGSLTAQAKGAQGTKSIQSGTLEATHESLFFKWPGGRGGGVFTLPVVCEQVAGLLIVDPVCGL